MTIRGVAVGLARVPLQGVGLLLGLALVIVGLALMPLIQLEIKLLELGYGLRDKQGNAETKGE